MLKGQKGITLVALVITIIVLLILAGVSISLVIGQNGILSKATNAVTANEEASAEQEVKLSVAECLVDYYDAWVGNQSVSKASYYTKTAFKNNCGTAASVKISPVASDTMYVIYTAESDAKYYFSINTESGKVSDSTATECATATTECIED